MNNIKTNKWNVTFPTLDNSSDVCQSPEDYSGGFI